MVSSSHLYTLPLFFHFTLSCNCYHSLNLYSCLTKYHKLTQIIPLTLTLPFPLLKPILHVFCMKFFKFSPFLFSVLSFACVLFFFHPSYIFSSPLSFYSYHRLSPLTFTANYLPIIICKLKIIHQTYLYLF